MLVNSYNILPVFGYSTTWEINRCFYAVNIENKYIAVNFGQIKFTKKNSQIGATMPKLVGTALRLRASIPERTPNTRTRKVIIIF